MRRRRDDQVTQPTRRRMTTAIRFPEELHLVPVDEMRWTKDTP